MYIMKNNDDHGFVSYAGIITSGKLHSNKVVTRPQNKITTWQRWRC